MLYGQNDIIQQQQIIFDVYSLHFTVSGHYISFSDFNWWFSTWLHANYHHCKTSLGMCFPFSLMYISHCLSVISLHWVVWQAIFVLQTEVLIVYFFHFKIVYRLKTWSRLYAVYISRKEFDDAKQIHNSTFMPCFYKKNVEKTHVTINETIKDIFFTNSDVIEMHFCFQCSPSLPSHF